MNTVLSPQAQTKALDIMPFADLRNQSCRDALCKSQDTFTRSELAKAVREMNPINAVGFQRAVLELLNDK